MKITVIIPTYNRDKVLCATIQQILIQDYKNFELIIVDQTKKHDDYTLKYFTELPPNVNVIKVEKPNLPAARNIGIKQSSGEIIVFLDDDMIVPVNMLSKLTKVYRERDDIYALSGFGETPSHPQESKYSILNKNDRKRILDGIDEITSVSTFNGFFMTFRKNIFNEVGLFDEWIGNQPKAAGEDFEFSLRVKSKGYKLYLLTDLTVTHLALTEGGCEARKDLDKNADLLLYNRTKLRFYSVYKNISSNNLIHLGKAFLYNFYTYFAPIFKSYGVKSCIGSISKFIEINKLAFKIAKSNRKLEIK